MKTTDFSSLLTRYLTHYLPVQRNLSSNTIRSYRDTFKLLLLFCRDVKKFNISRLAISMLDKKCIEEFLLWLTNTRGASASTYNQRLCAIHAFFDYVIAEEPGLMEQCVQVLNIPHKVTHAPPAHYLTPESLKFLLSMPDRSMRNGRRHLVLLTVLYDTAARVSELTDICLRDVRLEPPAVITLHGKGGKTRSVPLMKQTVALLKDYFSENNMNPHIRPDMPLFWNSRRQKLTRSGVTFILQKYAEMAQKVSLDIPDHITPHVMRHTKAMHLVQADVNPIYIKDLLGHADISTTEIYTKADSEAKRSALEKATAQLDLPTTSGWEQDTDLIEWLSSLG
ncbi:site-specific integrase [Flintibacter muris]|uniref:site-specific integrase n=1 Tax=Flintibacter muris TaxID=2941327 RepID=UPI00203ED327|nr:site-specific integrase [Flintibacter muris]